jgi:PEGA domain
MRRSTHLAPFSRLALYLGAALPAVAAFGVISFAPCAHAADAKPAAAKPALAKPATAPAAKPAADAAKAPDKKTRDAARKAYGEGEKAYAANDFAGAYAGFTKALDLIPTPAAAYWAAKSLDQQGKTDDAIKAYEALLADPNVGHLGDEKTSDAQTRLATLKAGLIGEVTVSSAALGAQLAVDGVPQTGPLPVVLKLAPGPHKLSLTAPGFDAKDLDIDVKAGAKLEEKVDLMQHAALPPESPPVPEIAPAPPPPPPPEKHSKVPAYVTLGIATGGAIVGTIFGVKALQSKSDFNKNPTTTSADDTERNALIADMAFGVAVTLGVTGIVLLTSSDDPTAGAAKAAQLHLPPKGTFRITPYLGRESGGASARLTF